MKFIQIEIRPCQMLAWCMYLHFITFVFIQFFTNCCLICCRQSHPGFVYPSVIVLCFLHLHIITESYQNFSVSQFINRGSLIKLSCQPLLDFSSFFLLCLIIPFCERWKQKKGKTKKQVETFSSLARTCAQIWTFLGATGVTGRTPDKWHFFPYHCTLPVTAQETMVSLFHRNTCRGKFGRHHSLVLLGPFLC